MARTSGGWQRPTYRRAGLWARLSPVLRVFLALVVTVAPCRAVAADRQPESVDPRGAPAPIAVAAPAVVPAPADAAPPADASAPTPGPVPATTEAPTLEDTEDEAPRRGWVYWTAAAVVAVVAGTIIVIGVQATRDPSPDSLDALLPGDGLSSTPWFRF